MGIQIPKKKKTAPILQKRKQKEYIYIAHEKNVTKYSYQNCAKGTDIDHKDNDGQSGP